MTPFGLTDPEAIKRDAVRERGDIPAVLRSCARTIKENRLNWFGAAEYLFKYAETVEHQQGSRVVAPSEKTGTQIFEEIQALLDQWRARDLMRKTDREQNG